MFRKNTQDAADDPILHAAPLSLSKESSTQQHHSDKTSIYRNHSTGSDASSPPSEPLSLGGGVGENNAAAENNSNTSTMTVSPRSTTPATTAAAAPLPNVPLADNQLLVDISDALSEKDKVKFTVHTRTTLPGYAKGDFFVVRQHEEFVWLHDRFEENDEYGGYIVSILLGTELGTGGLN